jgi:hypothetical protein
VNLKPALAKLMSPYLKNKIETKELESLFKWHSAKHKTPSSMTNTTRKEIKKPYSGYPENWQQL